MLRGGLHGRRPLSRRSTARRLHVAAGRVRKAERRGLATLQRTDAEQGCGLRSGAGRQAVARRLADGSSRALRPLPLAAPSPPLVSADSLARTDHQELAARASSSRSLPSSPSPSSDARLTTRRSGLVPDPGGDGSGSPAGLWIALLSALALGGAALLLLRRRRAAHPSAYSEPAQPVAAASAAPVAPTPPQATEPHVEEAPPAVPPVEGPAAPHEPPSTTAPGEGLRRRHRAVQALGGLAASGAAVTLLVGRLLGRRRRR